MKRPFQLLDQLGDIVEGQPGLQLAEIARAYPERLTRRRRPSTGQPVTQRFIDDLAERPAGPARLRLQLGRYIIVQGQSRPHALMLGARHHDVKEPPRRPCEPSRVVFEAGAFPAFSDARPQAADQHRAAGVIHVDDSLSIHALRPGGACGRRQPDALRKVFFFQLQTNLVVSDIGQLADAIGEA